MQSAPKYLTLSPNCSVRLLETPCVYDKSRDELYELDQTAGDFLVSLPLGAESDEAAAADEEFLDYCFEEGILLHTNEPHPRIPPGRGPVPSLRYLLLHLTTRCNLQCAHCFIGDTQPIDMPLEQIFRTMDKFDELQGLRLLVSGGEPLLHPRFWKLNESFDDYGFRAVVLSNGTLFDDPRTVERLQAHEVQVSLDGVGASHDVLRGKGAYDRALRGLQNLTERGIDISIATMVHAGNIDDFDELENVVRNLGAKEWNIDVPAPAGRWPGGVSLEANLDEVGAALNRAFGGGAHHTSDGDWTCGAHLCAVMADGGVCKCGFYADSPCGTVSEGLADIWDKIPRITIDQLRCDCDLLRECRGGCRYRAEMAGDKLGKDFVICAANGLPCETSRRR